jgi:hypothetical protein
MTSDADAMNQETPPNLEPASRHRVSLCSVTIPQLTASAERTRASTPCVDAASGVAGKVCWGPDAEYPAISCHI